MKGSQLTEGLYETLQGIIASIGSFYPELSLLILLVVLIIADLFSALHKKSYFIALSIIGLSITLALLIFQWIETAQGPPETIFIQMMQVDGLAVFLKIIFCVAAILSILLTVHPYDEQERQHNRGAYYIIFTGLVTGTFLLAAAKNLLMVYISLELISICSYLLTAFRFDKNSAEAGLKYILYGAVASGVMLYGLSLLYGFTGTLEVGEVFSQRLAEVHWLPLSVAILMASCGFLFKISAVPFHIWAPDVYHSAPLPIVAFFSVAPKLAGLAFLIRLSGPVFQLDASTFNWQLIVTVIACLTILVGNFSALLQKNARRMMAYSSIAHGGFLLIGMVVFTPFGLHSFLFYAAVYMIMNLGAFYLLNIMANRTKTLMMDDFKGLGKERPYVGILFVIVMIGLTGLPPTAGFTAKLLIFSSLWEGYQQFGANHLLFLLIFGVLNTIVSLFYYLKIPYLMFFKDSNIAASPQMVQVSDKIIAGLLIFLTLILFFKSNWLLDIINSITFAL